MRSNSCDSLSGFAGAVLTGPLDRGVGGGPGGAGIAAGRLVGAAIAGGRAWHAVTLRRTTGRTIDHFVTDITHLQNSYGTAEVIEQTILRNPYSPQRRDRRRSGVGAVFSTHLPGALARRLISLPAFIVPTTAMV